MLLFEIAAIGISPLLLSIEPRPLERFDRVAQLADARAHIGDFHGVSDGPEFELGDCGFVGSGAGALAESIERPM